MWTALVLLLLICGGITLWDAPDRSRRHAAERRSVLDALAKLRTAGTASAVAREVAHRTGLRPSDRVLLGHLAGLEEDGLIAVGRHERSLEPRYLLMAALPGVKASQAGTARALTVFHDGSCALCAAEIVVYRKARGAQSLCFSDVSDPNAALGDDLTRTAAMARFHVRTDNREILSGAEAFAALWQRLPGWRWLGRIVGARPVLPLAEAAYRVILLLRPWLARSLVAAGVIKPLGRSQV
jgi:predicted DCC family thiol-disulfide oxidoreductase YuxK